MGTFGRSCVKTKKFAFSQQIEKFPWHLRRGGYVSPKYYCESSACNWSLIIEPKRESFLGITSDYIEMRLKREDYSNECQSVDVNVTIADSSKIASNIAVSKEIDFTPSSNEETVTRLEKKCLFDGYWNGNTARFIPNDILTVKCEIAVYEIIEENYECEDQLEDITKYANRGFPKRLWWVLGFVLCALIYLVGQASRDPVAAMIAITIVICIIAILVLALRKIYHSVKPCDVIIYNESRK